MSTTTAATPTHRNGKPTAQQAAAAGSQDSPPAAAPASEPQAQRQPDGRCFSLDGVEWVAWVSGSGATGTGSRGLGLVEAVHFAPAASGNERRHREALIARGRFSSLFDEELLALFRTATPIPDAPPPTKNGQRNGRRR